MLNVRYSTKFKRDFRRCQRRNFDMKELQAVIDVLRIPEKLTEKYKDHILHGEYEGYSECHMRPDWLLIYKYSESTNELLLARTGSHSDIFDM